MNNADNDICQQSIDNISSERSPTQSITACFLITPDTPVEIVADLPKPESAAISAVRRHNASPAAKALHDANKTGGRLAQRNKEIDAQRKGAGREFHNFAKRAEYAAKIMETEGRMVRAYKKATPERRKEQKKAAKANMTPEQRKLESEKRKARRHAAKARKAQAIVDNSIF